MAYFPKDKAKIKARIRAYEEALHAEEMKFNAIMDSAGKRYSLGLLYLLADDTDGALKAFQWFEQKFRDDVGEPFHYLCWTMALLKSGDISNAKRKLLQTVLSNQYIIPILLGRDVERFEMWHSSNDREPEWIRNGPIELFELWDNESLVWVAEVYDSPGFAKLRTRQIEIYKQLQSESVMSRRKALLTEERDLREKDI
jgi:hypothetical protein